MNRFLWILATATLFGAANCARAELPPSAYQNMKAAAPEEIEVRIQSVSNSVAPTRASEPMKTHAIRAQAVVTRVIRSKSGLKVGSSLVLTYTVALPKPGKQGWVGPGPLLIVARGASYHAWLKAQGKAYVPAAMGQSLKPLAPRVRYNSTFRGVSPSSTPL